MGGFGSGGEEKTTSGLLFDGPMSPEEKCCFLGEEGGTLLGPPAAPRGDTNLAAPSTNFQATDFMESVNPLAGAP